MERLKLAMSGPGLIEAPELETTDSSSADHGWIVTVYDNDHNTVEEVLEILIVATGCSLEEAEIETWEIHNLGKSVVHHGGESECREAATIIAQIGIKVEASKE